VAVFGSGSRIGGGRGPSFGFRFFCYAVVSVVLMFYDRRGGWLDTARYGLQAAVYPLQLAVNSPSAAWRWMQESFTTRETLQKEVDTLRNQLRDQQLMTLRQAALESENATLRGLTTAMPEVIEKRLIGEVINVEVSTLRQRLLVNRGGNSGVHRAQPVITGEGVLGQVYRIGPFSSEIILITDSEHALPVQVLRSGVRSIALGTGRATALELPYVPQNYDVKVGDVLVTSGLDGVFPFGLPVARITKRRARPDPAAGADLCIAAGAYRGGSRSAVHLGAAGTSGGARLARSHDGGGAQAGRAGQARAETGPQAGPQPAPQQAPQETPPATTPGTEAAPTATPGTEVTPAPAPSPDNGAAPPPAEVPST
jgi:rod shape-determining protein MreC